MSGHIAIVEDEPMIAENYRDALTRQGYIVSLYSSREKAIAVFTSRLPDMVLIDIGLADDPEGGFTLCRELRAISSQLPIMFLTARDSEIDTISGLRLGADDYLTKDISIQHLTTRIVALFRRIENLERQKEEELLVRGDLEISLHSFAVRWQTVLVDLTITEFWIVHALANRPGQVKNRDQLMQEANVVLDDNTITSHIKRIRKKFKIIDNKFDAIKTVYGMGYRWSAH